MIGSPTRSSTSMSRHASGLSTLALPGVDMVAMVRGDGEWRNMQEVVRRTLKVAFETIDQQAKHIGRLTGQVATLQKRQEKVVSRDEILEMIEERLERSKLTGKKRYVLRPELESVNVSLAQLRQDMERKASMRYVHDMIRGKIDKSDIITRSLVQQSETDDRLANASTVISEHASNKRQLSMLFQDLASVKNDVEGLTKLIEVISREVKATNTITDYNVLKNQIESIYSSLGDYCTKTCLQALLDQKQNAAEIDALLKNKAEHSTVQAAHQRYEVALEKHEKEITSIRLKLNDGSKFDSDVARPLEDITNTKIRRRRRQKKVSFQDFGGRTPKGDSSNDDGYSSGGESWSMHFKQRTRSDGNVAPAANAASEMVSSVLGGRQSDKQQQDDFTIEASLQGGRIEAIVNGFWQKLNLVQSKSQHYQTDIRDLQHKVTKLQMALDTAAEVKQMETLGVVVEEQRLRIDSLILGSTTIGPIAEEMTSIQQQLSDLRQYLQLPQPKPLQSQLDEAGELIEVLSHRTAEIGTALGRAALRIEAAESQSNQLGDVQCSNHSPSSCVHSCIHFCVETRVQVVEHGVAEIAYLKQQCNFTDSEYHNASGMGRSLSKLWQSTWGGESKLSQCDRSELNHDLQTRVHSLERCSSDQHAELGELNRRIKEMKELVVTLGRKEINASRTAPADSKQHSDGQRDENADHSGTLHDTHKLRVDASETRKISSDSGTAVSERPINVDFETAMDQMFLSLDEMQIPVAASAATLSASRIKGGIGPQTTQSSEASDLISIPTPSTAVATGGRSVTVTSLSKVDERLQELKAEKDRLRELLLNRVDRT